MSTFVLIVFVLALSLFGIASVLVGYLLWLSSHAKSYAEPRTIICPENLDYAEVTVDGEQVARTALEGREEFRISTCSRWPEKQGCDQECAAQVPLVGDDRTQGEYAAFGMTPDQLRIHKPVRMSPDMFGKVRRQKVERYPGKKPA